MQRGGVEKPRVFGARGRRFRLIQIPTLAEWPARIALAKPHFALLLACDARGLPAEAIGGLAARALDQGLAYLCAWGPGCERVHDIFDGEIVARGERGEARDTIMTTWHAKDSLPEATWFFRECALPVDGFERRCRDWIAVVVGNPAWGRDLRRALARR